MPAEEISVSSTSTRTTVASIVAVVLVFPASLVGYGFRWLAFGLINRFYGGGSSFPFADEIAYVIVPNLLFGVVTGMVTVGATYFPFRRANMTRVATAVVIVWAILYVVGLSLGVYLRGLGLEVMQGVAILVGIALGSFTTAKDNASI